ncbi:AMP-binding protein [Motilimonas sp. KMU-193]|uniref:AMP-binding protein n=1 Tax=Motilimonas sp. KMU-193 TaxID=3388668 RepID=UPI00396B2580
MNNLLKAIKHWATVAPQNIAFCGQDQQQQDITLNYGALQNEIELIAAQLLSYEVKVLAFRASNSVNWALIDLAAMAANIILVPIPTFFSATQVEHTLTQSGADSLIGEWQDLSDSNSSWLASYQETGHSLAGYSLKQHNSPPLIKHIDQTAKITFTSGSTGQPKGVCLSQSHLVNVAESLATEVKSLSRVHMVLLPLSTLLENITGVYVPLLLGATSVILSGQQTGLTGSSHFDGQIFANALTKIQPHSLVLTPALLAALIQVVKRQPSLSQSLRFVAVGGARVGEQLIKAAHALTIPAYEGYGLSECGSVVCLNSPTNNKPGSCGKTIGNIELRIASDGEIWVRNSLALGYIDQPFTSQWLATGDLGQIDELGYVTLSGRKKNLIITAYGRNISPEWIESEAFALLPNLPFIVMGDGEQGLIAITGKAPNLVAQVLKLNQSLPDYAQIQTLFVMADPRSNVAWYTSNGKLKREQLISSITPLLTQPQSYFSVAGQDVNKIDLNLTPNKIAL